MRVSKLRPRRETSIKVESGSKAEFDEKFKREQMKYERLKGEKTKEELKKELDPEMYALIMKNEMKNESGVKSEIKRERSKSKKKPPLRALSLSIGPVSEVSLMLTPSRDKSPKPPRRRSTLVMSNSIISVVPAAVGATTKTRMGLMLLKVRMDMGEEEEAKVKEKVDPIVSD